MSFQFSPKNGCKKTHPDAQWVSGYAEPEMTDETSIVRFFIAVGIHDCVNNLLHFDYIVSYTQIRRKSTRMLKYFHFLYNCSYNPHSLMENCTKQKP